ncbi:hypothetical protein [Paraburkholderia phenoliruptrix]|uniref:hypothetical protein n=1 Tax=Paraburkholderia phenoliruptrix TaxID=252970 RepID=UPI001C6EEABE|nr:hypothetical protein [Paraburkholderia phenoliruptrix]MBW9102908.1 hypothetical protein [Paraburkholderia phenoliruptrix]MBW9132882.1 hypothetical protein [Paraburkholderia ginsengiterrae]
MFPVGAGAPTSEAPATTDADVGGIAATPAPADPWANPISALQKRGDKPYIPAGKTRADKVMSYLRENGPADGATLCKALGITSTGGISPYIAGALKDGRIVRADGKYSLGATAPAAAAGAEASPPTPAPAPTPAPDLAAVKAELPAIAHFEAATSIVARKPKAQRQAAPAPTPSPSVEAEPAKSAGRKPEFVVFVGDIQLLSWPAGDITIQTEACAVDLKPEHFRALMTLVELRK